MSIGLLMAAVVELMSPLMCSSLVAFQQQQQQLLLLLFDLDCKYDFPQPEIVC